VRAISEPKEKYQRRKYLLSYNGRALKKQYYASQLMKIELDKLIKDVLPLDKRPDYDPSIFNREKHLHSLHNMSVSSPIDLPKTAIEERIETKQRRIRKPIQRYVPS